MSFLLLTLILMLGYSASPAKKHERTEGISVGRFAGIVVLENGRKKPFDTYARNKLIQFSGRQKLKGVRALDWMVRLLLNPMSTDDDLVFLIDNPDVANALGIAPRTKRRYSFRELYAAINKIDALSQKALQVPSKEWTSFERGIVQTRNNIQEYSYLRSAFSFLDPQEYFMLSDSIVAAEIGMPVFSYPSYFDLLLASKKIAARIHGISQRGFDSLSSSERALVVITQRMLQMETEMKDAPPLIIPVGTASREWIGLWGIVEKRKSGARHDSSLMYMVQIRDAYCRGNQSAFDRGIGAFEKHVSRLNPEKISSASIKLEILYNRVNPFFFSKLIYGLAVLISLFAVSSLWKRARLVGLVMVLLGIALHSSGILARMFIMHHPPVTNLYETFVFTAWAAVLLGIVFEVIKVRSFGVLLSAVTGFLFLHLAGKYAKDGDTLGMLSAVLDSSFWLTTHIVTIALGYAGHVGAGLMAHIYLFFKVIRRGRHDEEMEKLRQAVYGMFVFGFLFTIVGTVFGGMWADQAWGRFWGWDPKENGALLIILWGIIVLHANVGRFLGKNGIAVGAVVGMMLVMIAWIGVNLLGVGLHSYGFSSIGANTLITYIGFEFLYLILAAVLIRSRARKL